MAARNISFDVARAISMFYIVGILHLTGYTTLSVAQFASFTSLIWSTLGVFTFLSAFLLSSRYSFSTLSEIMTFYKKRILRFYPLFIISSLLLFVIKFNTWDETWKGLLGISPFWEPQQHTLWYIATLIFLYFITPLLCFFKFNLLVRIMVFVTIFAIILVIQKIFHSVDPRLYYYFLVYFVGIISALYFPTFVNKILHSKKTLLILIFYLPIFIFLYNSNNRLLMMIEGYVGIIVILNISFIISDFFIGIKNSFQ